MKIDEILERAGLKYEDLNAVERDLQFYDRKSV